MFIVIGTYCDIEIDLRVEHREDSVVDLLGWTTDNSQNTRGS